MADEDYLLIPYAVRKALEAKHTNDEHEIAWEKVMSEAGKMFPLLNGTYARRYHYGQE